MRVNPNGFLLMLAMLAATAFRHAVDQRGCGASAHAAFQKSSAARFHHLLHGSGENGHRHQILFILSLTMPLCGPN